MKLTSAATLEALMKQKGVSYQDMALAADVSKGFISHLVRERRSTCTPQVADRIARRLDVPLDLIFVASLSASSGQNVKRQQTARAA